MSRSTLIVVAAALWAAAGPGYAQTSFAWSDRFAQPGAPGRVMKSALHDFGGGPEVCVVSDLTNKMLVLHLDGQGWKPVGPILEGVIHGLQSFDAGSGPELYACGDLTSSSAVLGSVFRWTGSQWVSTGFPGGSFVLGLTVFDFGAGPRLVAYRVSGASGGLWTWDGTTWIALPGSSLAPPDAASDFVTFDDGSGPRLFAASLGEVRKWTGSTWQTIGTSDGGVNALAVFDDGSGPALFAGGSFAQVGGAAVAAVAKWTGGTSWVPCASGLSLVAPPGAAVVRDLLAVQGGAPVLYAAGSFSHAGAAPVGPIATWNGVAWAPAASGYQTLETYPVVFTLAATGAPGSQAVFAGGNFSMIEGAPAGFVARRDPSSGAWGAAPAGAGGAPGVDIHASTVFDAGSGPELVVAGVFDSIGGAPANGIARWNGSTWQPLGSGFSTGGMPVCLASWSDASGPGLYVGGSFTTVGGIPCANIAKWNGSTWSPLGSGCGGLTQPVVRALMPMPSSFPGPPRLLVGGTMTVAGGIAVAGLAAWDGTSWSSVANVSAGVVSALETFDDGGGLQVYAGGFGGILNGMAPYGFQRFDGTTWSLIPGWTDPGLNNFIVALEPYDDGSGPALYLSTTNAPMLRKFTGSAVIGIASAASIGAGSPTINTLDVFDDGHGPALFLGGGFVSIAGLAAPGIGRYRAGAFGPPGGGVGSILAPFTGPPLPPRARTAVAHDDGSGTALFFGGSFTTAGGFASAGIAQWGAGRPVLSVDQPGGAGAPVFVHCSNLQVGREYLNIASFDSCGSGVGSGPYLGLCASDPSILWMQAMAPLECLPFHFLSSGTSRDFGPYVVPAGMSVEAITIDASAGHLWRVSAVESLSVQ